MPEQPLPKCKITQHAIDRLGQRLGKLPAAHYPTGDVVKALREASALSVMFGPTRGDSEFRLSVLRDGRPLVLVVRPSVKNKQAVVKTVYTVDQALARHLRRWGVSRTFADNLVQELINELLCKLRLQELAREASSTSDEPGVLTPEMCQQAAAIPHGKDPDHV